MYDSRLSWLAPLPLGSLCPSAIYFTATPIQISILESNSSLKQNSKLVSLVSEARGGEPWCALYQTCYSKWKENISRKGVQLVETRNNVCIYDTCRITIKCFVGHKLEGKTEGLQNIIVPTPWVVWVTWGTNWTDTEWCGVMSTHRCHLNPVHMAAFFQTFYFL